MHSSHSNDTQYKGRDSLIEDMRCDNVGLYTMANNLLETTVPPEPAGKDKPDSNQKQSKQASGRHKVSSNSTKETREIDYLFQRFMGGDEFRKGLRLQFEPVSDRLFAGNWVTVDLITVESSAREAGTVSLDFENEYFDMVLCTDLDRISRPASLIAELRRALRRCGQIWAQAPLSNSHNSGVDDHNRSYWYFTPKGFKVLFENFDEIACSVYQDSTRIPQRQSYFYGIKPEIASDDLSQAALPILPI